MWYKYIPPAALAATAVAFGVANKDSIVNSQKASGKMVEQPLSLEARKQKARNAIVRQMVIAGIPGLSIGVSVNGRIVWRQGFGFANLESGSRCTEDTVMRIASISKPLTAAITARLVQDGKLDLDKPIQTYLPEFPNKKVDGKAVQITTRQLLSHTAGIRHYKKKEEEIKADQKKDLEEPAPSDSEDKEFLSNVNYATVTDALTMFKDDELLSEPGTKFKYTTHGFTLVSAVLEKASGKEFKTLVEDLAFELGMRYTTLDVNSKVIPHRASYYKRNKKHILENCSEVNNSYKWAGGGILSNVTDLLTFANAILYSHQAGPTSKNAFLKKDVIQQLWKGEISVNNRTLAGLGWMRIPGDDYKGGDKASSLGGLWYHTGGAVGASSVLLIRPTSKTSDQEIPAGVCVRLDDELKEFLIYVVRSL
uniref:Beta-lactamase domain-containing protein n=1 Tax=Haemonchus contortus TaxID=6289 RepID=A0A7I4YPQ0_HAECO